MSETLTLASVPVSFGLHRDRVLPPLCVLPPIRTQASYSPFDRSPPLAPLEPSAGWPIVPGPASYFRESPRTPPSADAWNTPRTFSQHSLSPLEHHESTSPYSHITSSPSERLHAESRASISQSRSDLPGSSPLARHLSERAPIILSIPPTPAAIAEQRVSRSELARIQTQTRLHDGAAPPALGLGIRHASVSAPARQPQCVLRVRQQPLAARACGFGERDRRVIDPPPIVQLEILNPTTGAPDLVESGHSMNVVHASLWNARGTVDVTNLVMPGQKSARRLMGTLVASATVAVDEHNEQGAFFAFPDLSCRSQGEYRLRFSFMRVDPSGAAGAAAPVVAHVMSDVFTVYSAKDFPGMRPSTALTLALKRQGVAIQAKKGRYGVSSNSLKRSRESTDEDDEESTQGSEKRRNTDAS